MGAAVGIQVEDDGDDKGSGGQGRQGVTVRVWTDQQVSSKTGLGGEEKMGIKDYCKVSGLRMLVAEVREGHDGWGRKVKGSANNGTSVEYQ